MPSFDIEVEFEVVCARCGAGLCNQTTTEQARQRQVWQAVVEPCEHCLEMEAEEAADKARYEARLEFEKGE